MTTYQTDNIAETVNDPSAAGLCCECYGPRRHAADETDERSWLCDECERLTRGELTDDQIEALRDGAAGAGDYEQIEICNAALAGNSPARAECARVIDDAAAMAD